LRGEFGAIAETAIRHGVGGLIHRDVQSRNIMVRDQRFYVIDFQGARRGPIQYDLASLLIDPYVELPPCVQEQLLTYGMQALASRLPIRETAFRKGYAHCAITRNLQILGAFGYLSRVKGKTGFERYIPAALKTLRASLNACSDGDYPLLTSLVNRITMR